jgi:hypothetical protein
MAHRTRISAGQEEESGKVVVTVGSVRIEIHEDDPNKSTNVHITSPKTVWANVTAGTATTAAELRSEPKVEGQAAPTPIPTIH